MATEISIWTRTQLPEPELQPAARIPTAAMAISRQPVDQTGFEPSLDSLSTASLSAEHFPVARPIRSTSCPFRITHVATPLCGAPFLSSQCYHDRGWHEMDLPS
jgi:hypothetical protein